MQNILTYQKWKTDFINEKTSGEIFNPRRGKEINFSPKDINKEELSDEFFDLISIAYQEIGGHSKIKNPEDVFADSDWNFWSGIDIHGTRDFDIIMFGTKSQYGIKFSGVGHDGTRDAKRAYLDKRGKDLHRLGFYIEVSGKLAEILMDKYQCPIVTSQKEVEKVLNKSVIWIGSKDKTLGDAWYARKIGGHLHEKIMLGRPKV